MGVYEVFRYERKYVVPEWTAVAMRPFVRTYLKPDEYMTDELIGYRVHSLYFDTRQMALYRHSVDGLKNRCKLRVRFYDESAESPAFLEIKKRTTDTIHKLRAAVRKPAAERLLCGAHLGSSDLVSSGDASLRAVSEFCARCEQLCAEAKAFVSYRREAYVSHSAEGTRVTFDRQIVGHDYRAGEGLTLVAEETPIQRKGVVLELKYNGRIPHWMQDLILSFGLQRTSFPKYVYCVDALRADPAMAGGVPGRMHW